MTDHPNATDALIRTLVEARARRATSDGLLDAISARVATTSQGPRWVMGRPSTWLAVAAAVVVIAVGTAGLLGRGRIGGVGSSPTPPSPGATVLPSSSPSRTPSAEPIGPAGLDSPPLAAGSWTTVAFRPAVAFTVPAGRWSAGLDLPQQLFLRAHLPGAPADEIDAVTIVRIDAVYTDPCGLGSSGGTRPWPRPGDPSLVVWLARESPVDLGRIAATTVLGRAGEEVEREVPAGAYATCAERYLPIAPIEGGPSGRLAIPQIGQRFRLAVAEIDGQTIVVLTFGAPSRWDALVAATDQLLSTIVIR